mmetsp:Transcript_6882/g.41985  ORF Transcript_6882/g.41985 Transcript_6882/m.41985 type:complete len:83 (-) Transcript_6882:165-413(-)
MERPGRAAWEGVSPLLDSSWALLFLVGGVLQLLSERDAACRLLEVVKGDWHVEVACQARAREVVYLVGSSKCSSISRPRRTS